MKKKLSVNTNDFKELIDNGCYYVDKTNLIEDTLFRNKVIMYTRPPHFGKTLNMSMLYYFFSNKEKDNAYLFDGLKITKNQEMMKHQNQYPVIYLSLKEMTASSYQGQFEIFKKLMKDVVMQHQELLKSDIISNSYKEMLNQLLMLKASVVDTEDTLERMTFCLKKHYNEDVIVLIDDFDTPLKYAYLNGYYKKMNNFLSMIFSSVYKTNYSLEFGVLMGCLRFIENSYFGSFNNYNLDTMLDCNNNAYFGFTQEEIDALLEHYDMVDRKEEIKQWYGGYNFHNKEIYNPFGTMKYIQELQNDNTFVTKSFWLDQEEHVFIKKYIENANWGMKKELEMLLNGGTIYIWLNSTITYSKITYENQENLDVDIYCLFLHYGYLKYTGNTKIGGFSFPIKQHELAIPNLEVKAIFQKHFNEWFDACQKQFNSEFVTHLKNGNLREAQRNLSQILRYSIVYNNNDFYHEFMISFLNINDYNVTFNQDSQHEFEITLLPSNKFDTAIVIKCKYSSTDDVLIKDSEQAATQIIEKMELLTKGYNHVLGYGISFYKKQCYITKSIK